MGDRIFVTYEFEYRHEGDVAYESKQSAMWINTQAGDSSGLGGVAPEGVNLTG